MRYIGLFFVLLFLGTGCRFDTKDSRQSVPHTATPAMSSTTTGDPLPIKKSATPESEQASRRDECFVFCSGSACGDADALAQYEQGPGCVAIYRPIMECYKHSRCERQKNGACGWTETPEFVACAEKVNSETKDW